MKDPSGTNQKLIDENALLKQKIQELEHSGSEREQVEEALQRSVKEALRLTKGNEIVAEIGRVISSTISIEKIYKAFSEIDRKIKVIKIEATGRAA
jgi:flagellar biosynthesis regulator FlbT